MDVIKYHNTNPNSRIHVSAEMKNRRYRVAYVTTFTLDDHGTWGALIPFGFKHFNIEPVKTEAEAIKIALASPCAAEYTRDVPAEVDPEQDDDFEDPEYFDSDDRYGSRPGEGGEADYIEGKEPMKWQE